MGSGALVSMAASSDLEVEGAVDLKSRNII